MISTTMNKKDYLKPEITEIRKVEMLSMICGSSEKTTLQFGQASMDDGEDPNEAD